MFLALGASLLFTTGCERIDAGHVGMRVNMYGDDKGVSQVELVTGRVWYNPITTFVRTVNLNVAVNMKGGMVIELPLAVNYSIVPGRASEMFVKFRKHPDELETTYLPTQIRDAYAGVTQKYTVEQFIDDKGTILEAAKAVAKAKLEEGFKVDTITLAGNPLYPESVVKSIQAKINASQLAEQKQRELEQIQADAAKDVEEARGKAEAKKLEAEGIKALTSSLNPAYLRYIELQTWDGRYPSVVGGSGMNFLVDTRGAGR